MYLVHPVALVVGIQIVLKPVPLLSVVKLVLTLIPSLFLLFASYQVTCGERGWVG